MQKLILIGLAILIFTSVVGYSSGRKENIVNPTPSPASSPVPSKEPSKIPTTPIPRPTSPITYQEIGPDQSVNVRCGEGSGGDRVIFPQGQNGFAANIGRRGQTETKVTVINAKGEPSGGLVNWRLYYWGKLRIDGCKATFIAPDSIGTAYSVSAAINARVVVESPTPAPTSGGEGGPINAGYVATAKITILSGAEPTCYDPAGVAISINSVPTTSNVQIVVDTPRFLGRVHNGRNATVRDGEGTYDIQIFVNNEFYDRTSSTVARCQLPAVKF